MEQIIVGNACYHIVQNLFIFLSSTKNVNIRIYKTIILPAVLYGCESWSPTLKEEGRLWLSENVMPRKTFRPKQDKVIRGRRKLHNEELCNVIFILSQKLLG
jgi:hypothetical protein